MGCTPTPAAGNPHKQQAHEKSQNQQSSFKQGPRPGTPYQPHLLVGVGNSAGGHGAAGRQRTWLLPGAAVRSLPVEEPSARPVHSSQQRERESAGYVWPNSSLGPWGNCKGPGCVTLASPLPSLMSKPAADCSVVAWCLQRTLTQGWPQGGPSSAPTDEWRTLSSPSASVSRHAGLLCSAPLVPVPRGSVSQKRGATDSPLGVGWGEQSSEMRSGRALIGEGRQGDLSADLIQWPEPGSFPRTSPAGGRAGAAWGVQKGRGEACPPGSWEAPALTHNWRKAFRKRSQLLGHLRAKSQAGPQRQHPGRSGMARRPQPQVQPQLALAEPRAPPLALGCPGCPGSP